MADAIVIHKADLPGADAVEGQVRQTLALSGGRQPAVLRVSSRTGEGLDTLWHQLRDLPLRRHGDESSRDLLRLVQAVVATRFAWAEADPAVRQIVADWSAGVIDGDSAAALLLRRLAAVPNVIEARRRV